MSKQVIKWNKNFMGNLKYILYFISYILLSFIYLYGTAYILYLCDLQGLDDGWFIFLFMIIITFGPPIVGLYFIINKLHHMKIKGDSTFIKEWKLSDFANDNHAVMQIGEFQRFIGKSYHKCIFTKEDGSKIFVNFFPKLGELTASEISEREKELRIGLTVSNKLYLHSNEDITSSWETVILN